MKDLSSLPEPAELLVCVKCLAGREPGADGQRPGAALLGALADALPGNVTLTPVECLQNCDHGCTVALRGGARRWTYVYGNLSSEDAGMLGEGAALYLDAPDGVIPWRQRPEHFKRNCIARIPPLEKTPHG